MNHDPLVNFALAKSNVYLRRELVAWGDSVKLRFGDKPEDSPFLWQYMREYAEQTAKVFHGIRLDNCHSTPIHVAEYMLDAARRVRPNLYVIAELFTSSEGTDNIFINRLGINSMIREALTAWDSHEQGRLVHRFGGQPVGSFIQPLHRTLVPSMAHALFFDQTHDNPSPVEKRSVYDLIPTSAMIGMASCGSGSNRGYDELVPHHIHVVNEKRQYLNWSQLGSDKGMIKVKKAINDLHDYLGANDFSEVYVDQMDYDVVAVTRHCPLSHESFIMIAHTVFSKETDPNCLKGIKPLKVEGKFKEIVFETRLIKTDEKKFEKDPKVINGLDNYQVQFAEHLKDIRDSKMVKLGHPDKPQQVHIELNNFHPGSVIVFRFCLQDEQAKATVNLRNLIKTQLYEKKSDLANICSKLSLLDINHALFKCDQEERATSEGQRGVYALDGYGPLKYAGLQGVMSILSDIRPRNDLGNWLPGNLRNGNWMMDYIVIRLKAKEGTKKLGSWFDEIAFKPMKKVPRYLIPMYFDAIISGVYLNIVKQAW